MKIVLIGLLLFFISCSNNEYREKLNLRLTEIETLTMYDNTVVVYPDSFRAEIYGSFDESFNTYNPYQFLRDSAKTSDLEKLLTSEHPYVRTYAFAALSFRNYRDVFEIVLNNLKDDTKIQCFTDDYGFESTVADMMIEYSVDKFDIGQKEMLAHLILTKYNHLNTLNEILLFHKPNESDYTQIKEIVRKGYTGKFGIIALSRYQKTEDVDLIKAGFKMNDYYSGYKVFFMAIENYTNESFIRDLINYKKQINKGYDMSGLDYYFNALAKFHNKNCIEVIKEFVYQNEYESESYKSNSLSMIYSALKKYYIPEYDSMLKFIETNVDKNELDFFGYNHLDKNAWNY